MSLYQRTASIAAFSLMLGLAAAGCTKKQAALTPPPPEMPTTAVAPPAPPPPPGAPNAAPTPGSLSEDQLWAQKTVQQLNDERPLGDVYFDLDNAAIKDEGRAALSTNATYLKRYPSTRINIEGHCDERGTAEYNLALGERRANAVKAYLVELGVTGDRIVIVSKGKESPFCTEKNEACWQQNRRGHFIFTAK
ncbi:MAG TPA: peptidoglycan-associated lipoprotein Pal [Vicinamibacterales bacterium]|nr:peptidoglycan-associated lipoprotein Pal [Vicinamibacterales bacterium]